MKRIISMTLVCAMLITLFVPLVPTAYAAESESISKIVDDGIPGDINADGKVDLKDVVALYRKLIGSDIEVDEDAIDVNGDNSLTAQDVWHLFQYVSGWQGIEIHRGAIECDHEITSFDAKPATCIEGGNIQYWVCSVCRKYFGDEAAKNEISFEDTVISASGHTLNAITAKAATCIEDGNIAYWYCQVCCKYFADETGETEIDRADTVIASSGHTEVVDKAVAASCTATGLTEGKHCSVCKEVLVKQQVIDKLNHTPGAQATCTENQTCTVCGEVLVTANGHIPGVEATCSAPQTCTVCGTVLASATEHSLTYVPEKDPVDIKDPGNCAYWQCSECKKCYLDEEARTEIAVEDTAWDLFKVTFYIDETNSKEIKWYKVGTEVEREDLLNPQIDGYEFNYWSDATGKRVSSIPAENSSNIELYANTSITEYTISLEGVWNAVPLTYTIKQQVELPTPTEDGMIFAGWRAEKGTVEKYEGPNGVQKWRVPVGTTGDIVLVAQWKNLRDLVVPDNRAVSDRYVNSGYDEEEGIYWLMYRMGEIQNVVLDEASKLNSVKIEHHGGYIQESLTLSETESVEHSVGESVSTSVSHTVTESTNWNNTTSWEQSISEGINTEISVGFEFGADYCKAAVETSVGYSFEASVSAGGENSIGGGIDKSDGIEKTVENNFMYTTAVSQTTERTATVTHEVAPGTYYFANVGTVEVYAFVVYDPINNRICLETISTMSGETKRRVLSDKKESREYVSDELAYNIDIITESSNMLIEKGYYVPYPKTYDVNFWYNHDTYDGLYVQKEHTYGSKDNRTPASTPSEWEYVFLGWSRSSTATVPEWGVNEFVGNTFYPDGCRNLYAVWLKTEERVSFTDREIYLRPFANHTDKVSLTLPISELKANGYNALNIGVYFDSKRNFWGVGSGVTGSVELIANNECLAEQTWNLTGKFDFDMDYYQSCWADFAISIDDLNPDGSFTIIWTNVDGGGVLPSGFGVKDTLFIAEPIIVIIAQK